jgi:hypothetical protein
MLSIGRILMAKKPRDSKKEYKERNERARKAGFSSYGAQRKYAAVEKVRRTDGFFRDTLGDSKFDTHSIAALYKKGFSDVKIGRKMTRQQKAARREFIDSLEPNWFDWNVYNSWYARSVVEQNADALAEEFGVELKTAEQRKRFIDVVWDMQRSEKRRRAFEGDEESDEE